MCNSDAESEIAREFRPIIDEIASRSRDTYYKFVFRHPMDFYRQRARMVGAQGFARVLDAGQGYGQWTAALAEMNGGVSAFDHSEPMVETAKYLLRHFSVANASLEKLSIYDIGRRFEPDSFDLIWCWGVIMFVDRARVMPAFNRLLPMGGLVLLGSVNTPARWAYKLEKGRRDGIPHQSFFDACERGRLGLHSETGVNAFSRDPAVTGQIVDQYGFEVVHLNYDGRIDVAGNRHLPFESLERDDDENVEIVLRKDRAASNCAPLMTHRGPYLSMRNQSPASIGVVLPV